MTGLRYGFVGLGNLGRHLAGSLVREGFAPTVFDRDAAAVAGLAALGATATRSVAECARGRDAVITCLPSPAASRAVLAELLEVLPAGATWIEMSTNGPAEIAELAALAAVRGVATLEAPVTGGVHRAAAGDITVLVGGEAALLERHAPALRAMGGEVLPMGPLGQAAVIKVITNMLAFVHLVAAGEALMLARRGGLDLGQAFAAIRASSGSSFVFETEGQLILNGSYDVGFSMDLACKDLGFARALGERFGVPLEVAGLVAGIFEHGRARYGGAAQSTAIVRLLEDALGTPLRAEGFPARLG